MSDAPGTGWYFPYGNGSGTFETREPYMSYGMRES